MAPQGSCPRRHPEIAPYLFSLSTLHVLIEFSGEAASQPGVPSVLDNWPERLFGARRNNVQNFFQTFVDSGSSARVLPFFVLDQGVLVLTSSLAWPSQLQFR